VHNFILNFHTSCLRRISAMQRIMIMKIVFFGKCKSVTYTGWLWVVESAGNTRPTRSPRFGYGRLRAPARSVPATSPAARDPGDPAWSPPPPPPGAVPLSGLRRRGWYLYSGWSALCCWRSLSASCTNGFFPSSFSNLHSIPQSS